MRIARLTLLFGLLSGISPSASASDPHGMSVSSLPQGAQSKIWAAVGRDIPSYHVQTTNSGFEAANSSQKLTTDFTKRGVEVRTGNSRWRITLRGYGYGTAIRTVGVVAPTASTNRVEYQHGAMTEWYVNGPAGLEQGFNLAEPPGRRCGEPLTIALTVSGDLKAKVDGDRAGVTLTDPARRERLRYAGLTAFDATGKELEARLQLRGEQLLLQISDIGARYPILIDPWVQQGKLRASDGVAGDQLATAVAINGSTVVVGAFSATVGTNFAQGAAYVFVMPTSGWADMTQTAKLTASDGVSNDQFGSSVAVSGNVVVVGSPYAAISNTKCSGTNNVCFNQGAAYVYVEPANGWADMTETAKLTASAGVAGDELGFSVGVDGNTAVAGAPNAAVGSGCPKKSPCTFVQGAGYVFVQPANGWASMTQTAKLTASNGSSDDGFGQSVAISGTTVVVGTPYVGINTTYAQGAAYVYVEPQGGWSNTTETAELTNGSGKAGDQFGCSVGIDGTASTIAVGALGVEISTVYQQGAAYVYVMPTNGWTTTSTATAELTASDGATRDQFGTSVSINGGTLVVGAPNATIGSSTGQGAGYVYVEPSGGWVSTSTFDAKVSAADGAAGDSLGTSIAVSGNTLVVGAPLAKVSGSYSQGAGYVFQ